MKVLILLFTLLSFPLAAQTWDFVKEKEGIRIYTRKETGKTLRAYKGIAEIHAPAAKVFALLEDVHHTEWWDKNLTQIKVLGYEKNRSARYYLVYDLPWPLTDRDLCVDVVATHDPATGAGTITAVPLPGLIPVKKEHIRIREYRQVWTVNPSGKDKTQVILEGYVDPAGTIPDWVINMLIVDSPFRIISGVKSRMERSHK